MTADKLWAANTQACKDRCASAKITLSWHEQHSLVGGVDITPFVVGGADKHGA